MINEKKIESFFDIKIHKNFSSIVYFDNSSLKYFEKFNFEQIILQDILKICSITKETLEIILKIKSLKTVKYQTMKFLKKNILLKITLEK